VFLPRRGPGSHLRTSEQVRRITAVIRKPRRFLAVVEQWLSALRPQLRWHHMRESGLLAGLLGVRRVASGSGLLADTAPWYRFRQVDHRHVARLSRRLRAPLCGPGRSGGGTGLQS